MQVSAQGMMDIVSHEAICLEPYLDSVGVWTIGIGQTKDDGFDPRTAGPLTVQQAIDLFKRKIKPYAAAVDALGLDLKQHQYDALVSFCFNVGPGNLRKLCRGRSIPQIGEAMALYNKPPEIVDRRAKEQRLFETGQYSNKGQGSVVPVVNSKPRYRAGRAIDLRPYFSGAQQPAPPAGTIAAPSITSPAKGSIGAWIAELLAAIFRRK